MELLISEPAQVPDSVESGQPPMERLIVEVAVDSTNPEQLQSLRDRIRALRAEGMATPGI
jgi:hypothetical protein